MIDIVLDDRGFGLRYRFHLGDENERDERANIQDQIIAIVLGWA